MTFSIMENSFINQRVQRGLKLPTHAFHPNASFLVDTRKAYIAWPVKDNKE